MVDHSFIEKTTKQIQLNLGAPELERVKFLKNWKSVKIKWHGHTSEFPNVNHELQAISCLGKGSFATVYEALDRRLHRNVAVKVYEKRDLQQVERREFVQEELNILANIKHSSIVEFYRLLEDTKA